MISFLAALIRFVRMLRLLFADAEVRPVIGLVVVLLAVGTLFYHNVEGWSVVDSLYFCVITLATIGYGDLVPSSVASKVFTMIYLFIGMGLLIGFINLIAARGVGRFGQEITAKSNEKENAP